MLFYVKLCRLFMRSLRFLVEMTLERVTTTSTTVIPSERKFVRIFWNRGICLFSNSSVEIIKSLFYYLSHYTSFLPKQILSINCRSLHAFTAAHLVEMTLERVTTTPTTVIPSKQGESRCVLEE